MENSLELGMTNMFREAVARNTVLELRTDADWDAFNTIRDDAKQRETTLTQRFETERSDLIAAAYKELLRKAGSLTHKHPTPLGTGADKFDKAKIAKQAERIVDQGHQSDLLKLREAEAESYSTLRDSIRDRETTRGQSREAFMRAVDRHSGEDRRQRER